MIPDAGSSVPFTAILLFLNLLYLALRIYATIQATRKLTVGIESKESPMNTKINNKW